MVLPCAQRVGCHARCASVLGQSDRSAVAAVIRLPFAKSRCRPGAVLDSPSVSVRPRPLAVARCKQAQRRLAPENAHPKGLLSA